MGLFGSKQADEPEYLVDEQPVAAEPQAAPAPAVIDDIIPGSGVSTPPPTTQDFIQQSAPPLANDSGTDYIETTPAPDDQAAQSNAWDDHQHDEDTPEPGSEPIGDHPEFFAGSPDTSTPVTDQEPTPESPAPSPEPEAQEDTGAP